MRNVLSAYNRWVGALCVSLATLTMTQIGFVALCPLVKSSNLCLITVKSLNVNESSFKQAAVWSPWRDIRNLITLLHEIITSCAKRQMLRASSHLWKRESQVTCCIGTGIRISNGDFRTIAPSNQLEALFYI